MQAAALAKYMETTGTFVQGNNEQQYTMCVAVNDSATFSIVGYVDGYVDVPCFEDIDGHWVFTRCVCPPVLCTYLDVH